MDNGKEQSALFEKMKAAKTSKEKRKIIKEIIALGNSSTVHPQLEDPLFVQNHLKESGYEYGWVRFVDDEDFENVFKAAENGWKAVLKKTSGTHKVGVISRGLMLCERPTVNKIDDCANKLKQQLHKALQHEGLQTVVTPLCKKAYDYYSDGFICQTPPKTD